MSATLNVRIFEEVGGSANIMSRVIRKWVRAKTLVSLCYHKIRTESLQLIIQFFVSIYSCYGED